MTISSGKTRAEHGAGGPDHDRPRLVVGDDGSPAADQVWAWVNNHHWPGWQISVVTARKPLEPAPCLGAERARPHPWEPTHPRELINGDDALVEHLLAEGGPAPGPGLLPRRPPARDRAPGTGPAQTAPHREHRRLAREQWSSARPGRAGALAAAHPPDPALRRRLAQLATGRHLADRAPLGRRLSRGGARRRRARRRVRDRGGRRHRVTPRRVGDLRRWLGRDGGPLRQHVRRPRRDPVDDRRLSPRPGGPGSRGTGGFAGLFIGSVASAVAHHAPCSVLIAPSRAAAQLEEGRLDETAVD